MGACPQLFREQIMSRHDYDTTKANFEAATAQVAADYAQVLAAEQGFRRQGPQWR